MNHEQNPRGGESRGTGNFKLNIEERDLATGSIEDVYKRQVHARSFVAGSREEAAFLFPGLDPLDWDLREGVAYEMCIRDSFNP